MNPDPFIVADIETILDKVVEDNVEDQKILIQNVEDMDNEEYYETIKDMNNEEYNETIMDMDNEGKKHVPYACGLLVVRPGDDLKSQKKKSDFNTYFYNPLKLENTEDNSFLNKSDNMMKKFIERLSEVSSENQIRRVYFHNLSRFDGIIILHHYSKYREKYIIKPLMRNQTIYEIVVYSTDINIKKKKIKISKTKSNQWFS